jgi:hypothetical protein
VLRHTIDIHIFIRIFYFCRGIILQYPPRDSDSDVLIVEIEVDEFRGPSSASHDDEVLSPSGTRQLRTSLGCLSIDDIYHASNSCADQSFRISTLVEALGRHHQRE